MGSSMQNGFSTTGPSQSAAPGMASRDRRLAVQRAAKTRRGCSGADRAKLLIVQPKHLADI